VFAEEELDLEATAEAGVATTALAFSLSSIISEINGEERPSSQCISLLLTSSYPLPCTGVACLLAPISGLSGVFVGDVLPILLGVREIGVGIMEPSAFALEGEREERGESMVAASLWDP
jgi:hypothetical protein